MTCDICGVEIALRTHDGLRLCGEHKATQTAAASPDGAKRIAELEDIIARMSQALLEQIGANVVNDQHIKEVNQKLHDFMTMNWWQRLRWLVMGR